MPSASAKTALRIAVLFVAAALALPWPAAAQVDGDPPEDVVEDSAGAAPQKTEGLEGVVVTGRREAPTVARVPDSAMAFDSSEIEARAFTDISDLSTYTPNLEIKTAFAGTNPTLFIRGVGLNDYFSNAQSSVAVYNDGVYMNSPAGQLFQLFDTEGIEVLRGPQGSLNGRNATAGAILVSARKPSGDFGLSSTTTFGRFDQFEQEGALELPVVPDLLSARFAGRINRRDGITRNRCADPDRYDTSFPILGRIPDSCRDFADPAISSLESKVNDVNNWAARGLFRLQTDNGMDWVLNLHGGQNRALATHFQSVGVVPAGPSRRNPFVVLQDGKGYYDLDNPRATTRLESTDLPKHLLDPTNGDPYAGDYNRTGRDELDLFGTGLVGTWDIGDFTLHSVTGYEQNRRNAETDSDSSSFVAAEADLKNQARQLSESLRLDYRDPGGLFTFRTGGMVLYEELDVDNFFALAEELGSTGRVRTGRTQEIDQTTLAWGIFANIQWDPFENFGFEGGLRYNWDEKDFELLSCRREFPSPSASNPGQPVFDCRPIVSLRESATERWSEITGDASITYRPTEDVNFYLKYAKGWKPGQFNGSAFTPQNFRTQGIDESSPLFPDVIAPVGPETVHSFEIGAKMAFWNDQVNLSAAGFLYRYDDLQVFRLRDAPASPPINELINANDAQISGAELEILIRPSLLDGLQLSGAFGWLESEYNDFTQATRRRQSPAPQAATILEIDDYSGNRMIASPEYTFSGSAFWEIDLDRYGYITPRVDFTWRTEIFFDPNEGAGFFDVRNLPDGTLGDNTLRQWHGRLSYQTEDQLLDVAVWMRNITDEEYKVEAFDLSRGFRSLLFVIGQPRTYGVSITFNF